MNMLMIYNTSVRVPVNIEPLVDDTDFKTVEASVAYNAPGMRLRWNFVSAAGVCIQTEVTPTTSGNYDWAHLGDGMYSIGIPMDGGESINNSVCGYGWFTGRATGVKPWAGPTITFATANVVNSLVGGSDVLDVSMTQIDGEDTDGYNAR
jgi:hypothetical protein